MAGVFKEAVLTAKGIALLAKAQAGRCTIKLTKAATLSAILFTTSNNIRDTTDWNIPIAVE